MKRKQLATALLMALTASACQGGEQQPEETGVAPDRPAPAISNPQSPTPVGTDVGSVSRDTSGGVVANDSVAVPNR